jgi:hypothetical protein
MKIFIKKGNKSFGIRIPLGAIKLIPAGMVNHAISAHRDYDSPAPEIDFKELKKAIHLLKEYKGLKVIEVHSPGGEGLEVII